MNRPRNKSEIIEEKENININKGPLNIQNLNNNLNNKKKVSKKIENKKEKIKDNNEINNPEQEFTNQNLKEKETKKISIKPDDYLELENSNIIKIYGSELYQTAKKLEVDCKIPHNFIFRQRINPEIRTKMIDWMIEVLFVYKSEIETLFLSVYIMDLFIYRSKNLVKTDDIHLLGMTSMFIASKFEDVIPLRMDSLVVKVGHEAFNDCQIKEKEKEVLDAIEFGSLITTSSYEFIKTFFYDFTFNNKSSIKALGLNLIVQDFEKVAIFMSLLTLHFEYFYIVK